MLKYTATPLTSILANIITKQVTGPRNYILLPIKKFNPVYRLAGRQKFPTLKACFRKTNYNDYNARLTLTSSKYEVCLKNIGTICFAQTTLATVIKALFFKMAQCLVVVKM